MPDAPPLRRTTISLRLVAGLAVFSLLVSIAVTALQLRFDYQRRLHTLQQDVDERVASLSGSIADAIWMVNPDNTRLLLEGLARTPGVARVQLRTLDDERLDIGAAPLSMLDKRRFVLAHAPAGPREVGVLEVTLEDSDIRRRVAGRLRAIALTTLATVLSGCVFVYLLYRRLLVRHLERIAGYARQLDLEHLDRRLELDRPAHARTDELDLVVAGFDRMRARMLQALELRRQHEEELELHRTQLEQLVHERTDALSQRNRELQQRTLELDAARARAESLANTDHLTGVGNRRHFYASAQATLIEAVHARGGQTGIGVLMVDIDHFKQVNDRYGHASGDRVIAEVAARLRAAMPQGALVGRLGGEEFAAMLADTDIASLRALAERIRADVQNTGIPIGVLGPLSCTVSIGIATGDGSIAGIDDLLAHADDALYQAKAAGRNRVVAWSPATDPATRASAVRRRDEDSG
jgi:diguanylate cyclase (GGDEF)-like protein